ncbi:hypothetical protein RHMOL_Rhmol07G0039000 [Rhododendron molle]|uniref:Uncharacterized protein n=1 Tax=Rhododendron molle TaxID=49168 RepID=A0ACC0MXF3_RHOML|nr:hypothetical protein RHMOL_Rhmol07G0039000 [Rhododendron molle]
MQIKSCHIIQPLSAASPAKSSLPANKVSLPVKTPRAISITAPSDLVSTTDVIDDSTAAFRDYQSLWVSQRSETAAPVTLRVVDGTIPADFPPGTYYLTGPGLFSDDHGSTVHPLDGHGYLRTFTIDGAKEVKFMARYIETEAQVEERDPETGRWRFTHRGPFSVLKGGKMVGNTKVMKNVANTSVVRWGGRLLCLWEGGEPYEIESRTLETLGKVDVINGGGGDPSASGGGLKADVWDVAAAMLKPILYGVFNMPPKRFLSHYKIDARRNRLMVLSCNAEDMLLPRSHFTFYEFDTNFKLVQRREFTIPEHLMIHDWAFTDSHYILFGNRIKLDITGSMAAVCGLSPMISALTVNPSKPTSPIYLLPRFPAPVDHHHDQNYSVRLLSLLFTVYDGFPHSMMNLNQGKEKRRLHSGGGEFRVVKFQRCVLLNKESKKLDPRDMGCNNEKKLLKNKLQIYITLCRVRSPNSCMVDLSLIYLKAGVFVSVSSSWVSALFSAIDRRLLRYSPVPCIEKTPASSKVIYYWTLGTWGEVACGVIRDTGMISSYPCQYTIYILLLAVMVSSEVYYYLYTDSSAIILCNVCESRLSSRKSPITFLVLLSSFWLKRC